MGTLEEKAKELEKKWEAIRVSNPGIYGHVFWGQDNVGGKKGIIVNLFHYYSPRTPGREFQSAGCDWLLALTADEIELSCAIVKELAGEELVFELVKFDQGIFTFRLVYNELSPSWCYAI